MRIIPDNFQVLCLAVPSAFYYFPGKTIEATQAQKVTFPLPPKLEKLQVCKLMPGACKEAETVHVGCLCINSRILDKNQHCVTIYLQLQLTGYVLYLEGMV